MGPEDLAHGVPKPGPTTSGSLSKIARILVEKRREDRLSHVIADDKIAIRGSEIPAISGPPLPEGSICVGELALGAKQSRQHDGPAIKRILGRYLELGARCEGRVILQAWR